MLSYVGHILLSYDIGICHYAFFFFFFFFNVSVRSFSVFSFNLINSTEGTPRAFFFMTGEITNKQSIPKFV